MVENITYFEYSGKENIEEVINLAENIIQESNFKYFLVPTSTGNTVLELMKRDIHKKIKLVAVTTHSGFKGGDTSSLHTDVRKDFEENGITVLQGTHSLSGIERALSRKYSGISPSEIISEALKIFGGDGIKVAVEIAIMAADSGLVPTSEEILVAGGTSGGLDTLVSLQPAHMNNFFDINISKIYAKPLNKKNKN